MTVCGRYCSGCPWESKGTIFIPEDGIGTNGVMLVGDSGWNWEASTTRLLSGYPEVMERIVGTPFSGPSGWWIDKNLARTPGTPHREDFTIANTAWCKAPRLGLTDNPKCAEAQAAIEHCRPHLDALIAARKPKVLVPMGGVALHRLTGLWGIEKHHAYVLPTPYGIPAIPAFHPSYIIQGNQKYTGCWSFVIQKALAIARAETEPRREYTLYRDISLSDAIEYFGMGYKGYGEDYLEWLICDTETYESPDLDEDEVKGISWKIVRISFSIPGTGTGLSIPFAPPYLDLIATILKQTRNIVFWNQAFDVPRLRAAGMTIGGRIHDAMWAWHFLQSDLPKALGFAAPLLVNIEPWKHLSHADPARYSALDAAITADCWQIIRSTLEREGRFAEFERQCTSLLPVIETMTDHGVLIDSKIQSKFLDEDITKERDALFAKIQTEVPVKVRPVKTFKKSKPKKLDPHEIWMPDMLGKGGRVLRVFNPMSPTQRKALFHALDIPVPYNKKRDSESIEQKHLRKYARKHPILRDIMDYSERQKLITAYDWPLQPDGRIHPVFGFNPSTWRKSATDPNIQTIPKRSDLAKRFREMIVAAPGSLLIECDSSAIEAVLVGWFADSREYIALAKRGVHKWLAEKFAGRPVSKSEPLYDKIKRIVHLSNYLGSPMRIAEEYPDDFASVAEARKLQDFYFDQDEIRPIRAWQADTIARAAHDYYLQTPFKVRHYFFDALQADGVLGSDAKRSVAFLPQSAASSIETVYIHRLCREGLGKFLVAIIHDSIIMEVPESWAKEAAQTLYDRMTEPITELGDLAIGAECKIGPNLAHMEALK